MGVYERDNVEYCILALCTRVRGLFSIIGVLYLSAGTAGQDRQHRNSAPSTTIHHHLRLRLGMKQVFTNYCKLFNKVLDSTIHEKMRTHSEGWRDFTTLTRLWPDLTTSPGVHKLDTGLHNFCLYNVQNDKIWANFTILTVNISRRDLFPDRNVVG